MDTKLKERIREKLNVGFNGLKPDIRKPAIENLTEIIEDIYSEVEQLNDTKVSSSEIKLLIQEMHSRFDKTDMKLESLINELHTYQKVTDKRFEDMMHHSDKRFEVVDKRFEDLIHYMDKRFSSLQWFIGIGFTLLAALITIFTYFNQLPNVAP